MVTIDDEKRPLLYAPEDSQEYVPIPFKDDEKSAGFHDAAELDAEAAAAAARAAATVSTRWFRRRRSVRQRRRCNCLKALSLHLTGLALLVLIAYFWFYNRVHPPEPEPAPLATVSLDAPLELPCMRCFNYHQQGAEPRFPPESVTYPLDFGRDHPLVISQTVSHGYGDDHDHDHHHDHDHDHDHDHKGHNRKETDGAPGKWRNVHINGDVVFRSVATAAGAQAKKEPSIDIETLVNDQRIHVDIRFDPSTQSLTVHAHDRLWDDDDDPENDPHPGWPGGVPCLVVRVTVWVPATEARLQALWLDVVHLGVQLVDDLDLRVDEAVGLTTVVGSVNAARSLNASDVSLYHPLRIPSWSANNACTRARLVAIAASYRFTAPAVAVHTTSGHITGPWSLQSRLDIASVSGNEDVAVAVIPTAAASSADGGHNGDEHGAASLTLKTVSGNVRFLDVAAAVDPAVNDDTATAAARLTIATASGNIWGRTAFVDAARIHSVSGRVNVALEPVRGASPNGVAMLETSTTSGTTRVEVLGGRTADGNDDGNNNNNINNNEVPLNWLQSHHKSVSGSIELHYPASWVGHIHLESTARARLTVAGKDVRVLPGRRPWWPPVGRKLEAVKGGEGENALASNVTANTVSGSISLSFPE
ncbi:hypothetical protein SPI_06831 [Niveomyces insectorum RCEF 264]|uniref:Adhesin domain-containing protein n=1 Tax=Niveomyces insectorum RCEF 264 TaxID=1081102 RepID=A0A167QTA3_9HYPO|nr:hypothetical protein SPI_06831 [Niveomyces insectorum RCEF 264]